MRHSEVDQLRAFALLGICLVNMPFIAAPILSGPPRFSGLDIAAEFVISWLGVAKFFLLFAFLFGWGFGVQERSAARALASFKGRFLRRSLGLLVIGIAHALLVFAGDILIPYALIGLLLFLCRKRSDAALARLAGGSVVIAAALLAALAVAIGDAPIPPDAPSGYTGDADDVLSQRFQDWQIGFPFILWFNGPLIFGAFCLGLRAQRTGFLTVGSAAFDRLRRHLPALWVGGMLLNLPFAAAATGLLHGVAAGAALVLLAVAAPILSAAYLVTIVNLSRRNRFTRSFGAAGRMSLTAYVAEGALGGALFIGGDLFNRVGTATIAMAAVAIYLIIEVACARWMRRHAQGPLESVLRRLTYGR